MKRRFQWLQMAYKYPILLLFAIWALSFRSFGGLSQGQLGPTSTGTLDLSITKANQAQIFNLQNFDFGTVINSPNQQFIDICVFASTGSYDIKATSDNGFGQSYRMANSEATSFITYNVAWGRASSGSSGTRLNNDETSSIFNTTSESSSVGCKGGNDSRLFISILSSSFDSAPADSYSDVLTLLVTPQ